MRKPDFFLVGAPRCGTTALFAMLGAHPGIFASPVKEPDFFAPDIREAVPALAGRAIEDWSRYLELFRDAAPTQLAGEGSVSYLASRLAAGAIHGRCPDARILMILRDPAERLFSHYRAALVAGVTRMTFEEWLTTQERQEARDLAPIGPVAAGRYGTGLQRYRSTFSPSAIHVVWYEDFVRDAAGTLRHVFQFLAVDHRCEVPSTLRRNETRMPRWPRLRGLPPTPRLTADNRAQVIQLYADELRLLADLTGRNLGRWTAVTG